MIIWTFRIQKLKIGSLADFEKKSFSSLFLMRKPLSSDQKWFLRPYFPLIGGIFVLKSGLRFLFRALEVPIRKVRKRPLFTFFFSQSMLLPLVSRQNSQNWSKFAKFGQHFAFSMLKSTPARKKYTTAGCGGCDKYELWLVLLHPPTRT